MYPGVKEELACRGFRLTQWLTGGWHWLGATRACRL